MSSSCSRLVTSVAFSATLVLLPGIALVQLGPPTNLDSTDGDADSGASRTFTWNLAPEENEITHYQYRLSTNDGAMWEPDWTVIPGSDANTTSFLLTGLTYGITYKFQLRAVNVNTESPPAEETFTPLFAAPTNLKPYSNFSRVDLEWDTNPEVATYRVDTEVTSPNTFVESSLISATVGLKTTTTILGLTNGTGYTFTVVAVQGTLDISEPSSVNATPELRTQAGVTVWPTPLS